MADNNVSKTMVKKRYSARENAMNKSIGEETIDLMTGQKKEGKSSIQIDDVKRKQVKKDFIMEARGIIMASDVNNSNEFYKNLREPSFQDCEIKELEKGFNIVKNSYSQSKQKDKLWFDLETIINEYKKEDNFDAYILGVYYGLRAYTNEHLLVLDKLFSLLKDKELTEYNSFLEYLKKFEFMKNKDSIDEGRYQDGMSDLLFKTKLLDD